MVRRLLPCTCGSALEPNKRSEGKNREGGEVALRRKGDAPSTNIFRVAAGSVAVMPSRARVRCTWQPRRDVSVRPNAMSSMSFSSSCPPRHRRTYTQRISVRLFRKGVAGRTSGSGSWSYVSGSRMTWHVEHATDPSHAPARGKRQGQGWRDRKPLTPQSPPRKNKNGKQQDAPSRSISYSCATASKSSPSLASTVRISSPLASLKWTLILRHPTTELSARGGRRRQEAVRTLFPARGGQCLRGGRLQ